jgi:hypothetical protein
MTMARGPAPNPQISIQCWRGAKGSSHSPRQRWRKPPSRVAPNFYDLCVEPILIEECFSIHVNEFGPHIQK